MMKFVFGFITRAAEVNQATATVSAVGINHTLMGVRSGNGIEVQSPMTVVAYLTVPEYLPGQHEINFRCVDADGISGASIAFQYDFKLSPGGNICDAVVAIQWPPMWVAKIGEYKIEIITANQTIGRITFYVNELIRSSF